MINVLAITGGINDASSRFRVRQNINSLINSGINVHDYQLKKFGRYPPENKFIRPCWGLGNLLEHILPLVKSYSSDMVWLQKEFLSTYYTLERFLKGPIIFDVDDAIFVYRNGKAAISLARISSAIICGNKYLAEYFLKYNNNVHIIPTAVDSVRYYPLIDKQLNRKILVWSGSSSGLPFLYAIESAIEKILSTDSNIILRVVSDKSPNFSKIKSSAVEFLKWSQYNEVQAIQTATVGLMPLIDNIFTRGKCSYKMLTYMSCGIPVVVSPVGMNSEILDLDNIGFSASTENEWVERILYLLQNPQVCVNWGLNGRNIITKYFDRTFISTKIANVFKGV